VLLVKGLPSVVASPDGRAWICATGNPALATAGTGDVLAGMCAGLLAQGLAPTDAAAAAMHVGGAAADRFATRYAPRSMTAMDLVNELPSLLKERFEEG
jgi:NAD(P)H-hydrate epimerase